MPFSTQFSLSLELTNLVPIVARLGEILKAVVRYGSDPETERLTMEVFGRNKIERGMERTFREVTQFSTDRTIFQQSIDIALDSGGGPTFQRALSYPEYLATIIQLSMLAWCHDADQLAEALANSMKLRVEGAPPELQISPRKDGLKRFVTTCEELSSTFPWQRFFDAVLAQLGIEPEELGTVSPTCYRLNVRVLQACLDMLTAVQASREQRILRVYCHDGIVTLVVWAHCVLGLEVSVSGSPNGTVSFGDGEPTVFLHIEDSNTKVEACLFDSAQEIILVVDAADASIIHGELKIAAKGYGTSVLRNRLSDHTAVADTVHVIAVLAFSISQHLDDRQQSPCRERHNIISAINFLFDGVDLDESQIQEYFPHYSGKCIDGTLRPPPSLMGDVGSVHGINWWSSLVGRARALALFVVGLSCVAKLELCEQWRLGSLDFAEHSEIGRSTRGWDGKAMLPFCHDTWYCMLCRMMGFDFTKSYRGESFLFSRGGWSIWMSSFGDIDPLAMVPGVLFVQPGVPTSRLDGEQRHQLVDDPAWTFSRFSRRTQLSWKCNEQSGETTWPRCETPKEITLRSFTAKETINPDAFVVAVSFGSSFLYSGYREMHQKRSEALLLRPCSHPPNRSITLPENTAAGTGLYGRGNDDALPRVCISLVRGNKGARWLLVLGSADRGVALTTGHVCLECAIDQTLKLGGNWFIVC